VLASLGHTIRVGPGWAWRGGAVCGVKVGTEARAGRGSISTPGRKPSRCTFGRSALSRSILG
jgi:hypothetical protein